MRYLVLFLGPLLLAHAYASFQPSPAALRKLFEEELKRRREQYGGSDLRTAEAARDLGLLLRNQGDASAARIALLEAVRIDEGASGPGAPQTLADVAELAGVSGLSDSETLWLRAAKSPDARIASRALASLGQLREASGEKADAVNFYRRALVKEEQASGPNGALVAARLNALAQVVDVQEGVSLLERALAISRRQPGARHPDTATIELNLATLLLQREHPDEAVRMSREALSIFEATLGLDHPRTTAAAKVLVEALREAGKRDEAEDMQKRLLIRGR
jgi:tetratricopeptide (TPR) repeat protein